MASAPHRPSIPSFDSLGSQVGLDTTYNEAGNQVVTTTFDTGATRNEEYSRDDMLIRVWGVGADGSNYDTNPSAKPATAPTPS